MKELQGMTTFTSWQYYPQSDLSEQQASVSNTGPRPSTDSAFPQQIQMTRVPCKSSTLTPCSLWGGGKEMLVTTSVLSDKGEGSLSSQHMKEYNVEEQICHFAPSSWKLGIQFLAWRKPSQTSWITNEEFTCEELRRKSYKQFRQIIAQRSSAI